MVVVDMAGVVDPVVDGVMGMDAGGEVVVDTTILRIPVLRGIITMIPTLIILVYLPLPASVRMPSSSPTPTFEPFVPHPINAASVFPSTSVNNVTPTSSVMDE